MTVGEDHDSVGAPLASSGPLRGEVGVQHHGGQAEEVHGGEVAEPDADVAGNDADVWTDTGATGHGAEDLQGIGTEPPGSDAASVDTPREPQPAPEGDPPPPPAGSWAPPSAPPPRRRRHGRVVAPAGPPRSND